MALKRLGIPYLTTAQREALTPNDKDLILDTDLKQLFIGDGSTVGGIAVGDTGSGNYLPLSGGVMTGGLTLNSVEVTDSVTLDLSANIVWVNSTSEDSITIGMPNPETATGFVMFIYVIAVGTGNVMLDFGAKLNGTSDIILTSADIGMPIIIISNGVFWYQLL